MKLTSRTCAVVLELCNETKTCELGSKSLILFYFDCKIIINLHKYSIIIIINNDL